MAVSFSGMPPPSSVFAAYASLSAFIMLLQTLFNQFVPRQLQTYVLTKLRAYFKPKPNHATIVVEEREGISSNELFYAAETYLCTKIRPTTDRLKISKRRGDSAVTVRFAQSEKIPDSFDGIDLEWRFVSEEKKNKKTIGGHVHDIGDDDGDGTFVFKSEKRFFELRFDGKHKDKVIDSYFPFVLECSRRIATEKKVVKLHTLSCVSSFAPSVPWDSINLDHPSTFETLAMDPTKKQALIADLDRFVRRKDFYRKVGRAWKRGYLLYGPPGTGKSSLIAAMANYLKFDIYDLELANIKRDSDLRRLLLRTANRSILVIEDIDCTVELPDRKGGQRGSLSRHAQSQRPPRDQFTLSGLLNFIDGLWSSCGDQRIIIFTTNNKHKLDPALLRPGRMDMHIHMSYLTPHGFRLLASTYLNLDHHDHPRLAEIEDLINNMNVTPAEVAEELMKSDDSDASLDALVDFLECKKKKKNDEDTNDDDDVVKDEDIDDDDDEGLDGGDGDGEEEDGKVKDYCNNAAVIMMCGDCGKERRMQRS